MGGEGRLLVAQCAVLYGVGSEGATMMESNPYSWYMSVVCLGCMPFNERITRRRL